MKSDALQIEQMKIFADQIDRVAKKSRKLIITGDANLDSSKWNDEKFLYKSIASPLRNCLEQNGIKNDDSIGNTYLADHVLQNGTMPESALDHLYYSEDIDVRRPLFVKATPLAA